MFVWTYPFIVRGGIIRDPLPVGSFGYFEDGKRNLLKYFEMLRKYCGKFF